MTHTDDPLRLGATIGILGSGQLGRMLAIAAAQLGFKTHIYSDVSGPAFDVASRTTTASFDDAGQVATFAEQVDVVTYEFENVPLAAADAALAGAPVRPGRRALEVAQHRLTEKTFLRDLGCNVPQFFGVQSAHDLADALPQLGGRAVLKTCRFGYDGKGQARLTATSDAAEALGSIGGPPAIVEAHVDFDFEVSVVLARSANGDVVHYDPSRNVHIDGILSTSTVPSGLSLEESRRPVELASMIAEALDYVGVLAVEFFVCKTSAPGETQFLVNEIAPRVHNSGHWT
ncbi:MAG: ATP-grasp domain-containing protein, partial [Pseudomonadota bacterium]